MPDRPLEPENPADAYDPKTDEKVDQIERNVHAGLSEERELLESLDATEKEIEAKLRELEARKERILRHGE